MTGNDPRDVSYRTQLPPTSSSESNDDASFKTQLPLDDSLKTNIQSSHLDNEFRTVLGSEDAKPVGQASIGVLANYELLRQLGQGGMGTVYLARHRGLGRLVALKTISRGGWSNSEEISRFRMEAELAAKLDHKNIASIYEIGESNGVHYLAMQFIDGETLDSWQKKNNPSPRLCASLTRDIALAMYHAHQHGVIHRDLKPGNVMIDSKNSLRIVDFGLAKMMSSESSMTVTGQIMGTPSFMAPEQASGKTKEVNELADVYAIGAILFYLLTGKPPFVGNNVIETLDRVQNLPAPAARTINRRVPLDLSTICAKCLEKRPSHRYASAKELADDLDRFLEHIPVLARRISLTTRTLRWCRRNPLAASFMVVVSSLLAVTTSLYFEANRAVADAQESFERQVQTINELLVQIGSSDLKNIPNSHAIRRNLLGKAEKFYAEVDTSNARYSDIDDLYLQAVTQLASIQGELATTPQERQAALAKLELADKKLTQLINDRANSSQGSIIEAIATYSLTPELAQWWNSLKNLVDEKTLVAIMRQQALTDNLVQQTRLHFDQPQKQVELCERVLEIRQRVMASQPNDIESRRRLAGAYHNLAESLRGLAFHDQSKNTIDQAIEKLKQAQEIRQKLLTESPSDRLRLETAKGYYAIATALYAARYLGASDDGASLNKNALEETATAFKQAVDGFAACADSDSDSQEARLSQAIALRELAVLWIEENDLPSETLATRLERIKSSCELLFTLSSENPLVQRYAVELLQSRCCLYRIRRLQRAADSESPQDPDDRSSQLASLKRDLNQARNLAIQQPATGLECYLLLAQEAFWNFVETKSQSEALELCNTAKSTCDSLNAAKSNPRLVDLITFFDQAVMVLKSTQSDL